MNYEDTLKMAREYAANDNDASAALPDIESQIRAIATMTKNWVVAVKSTLNLLPLPLAPVTQINLRIHNLRAKALIGADAAADATLSQLDQNLTIDEINALLTKAHYQLSSLLKDFTNQVNALKDDALALIKAAEDTARSQKLAAEMLAHCDALRADIEGFWPPGELAAKPEMVKALDEAKDLNLKLQAREIVSKEALAGAIQSLRRNAAQLANALESLDDGHEFIKKAQVFSDLTQDFSQTSDLEAEIDQPENSGFKPK